MLVESGGISSYTLEVPVTSQHVPLLTILRQFSNLLNVGETFPQDCLNSATLKPSTLGSSYQRDDLMSFDEFYENCLRLCGSKKNQHCIFVQQDGQPALCAIGPPNP
eukprot:6459584-Amphidinium_carterae.1